MILLVAVVIGLLAGSLRAGVRGYRLTPPNLNLFWLVPVAFVPQFMAFYLPVTQTVGTDYVVAVGLVSSQIGLLIFAWANRHQAGIWLLGIGLLLNLLVISLNGGLMPISPEMVEKLHAQPESSISWGIGDRVGVSKNIMLSSDETHLWFLSDRFYLPLPRYRVAYSLGDVFIALGAFWFLWAMGGPQPLPASTFKSSSLLETT